MSRSRLIVISSIASLALAGACGSSQPSTRGSTPTTSPKRLNLASTGSATDASADAAQPAIYPVRPTRYVLDAPLPDLGASAPVTRMNAHPVSEADVQRFADALDVGGSPRRTATGWEVQGTDATLSVDLSGGVARLSYSTGVPSAVGGSTGAGSGSAGSDGAPAAKPTPGTTVAPPSPPVDVPDAADAQATARSLLERMGVLGDQSWSSAASDTGDVAVTCAVGLPCPIVPPEARARTVTFSLVRDAKRVNGIEWSVTIGEHRRIESVYGEWASPATIGSYPLRSTADVFADLENGTARYAGGQPMTAYDLAPGAEKPAEVTTSTPPAVVVHVAGVSLGVARWEEIDQDKTVVDLVPTYEFHARVDGGTTYDIVVLAVESSAVTFVKPAPTPEPLPADASG